jgi:uncharacterized glyoxalase superfamily protein PhnB
MSVDDLPLPRRARIVAPVSRHLRVANSERSIAFYRDVLGFSVHGIQEDSGVPALAEVSNGPGRIQFSEGSGETTRSVIFFETDDVAGLRAAIAECGGRPSALEDVNGIKMRVFEVRDPDDNALWFGQSYAEPDRPRPSRMMESIMPELPLDDVPGGVAYYRDVLGFEINYQQHDIGVMDRDRTRLLLIARTERHRGIGSCYFYVEDVDALYEELVTKGAHVQGPPISRPWGLREFSVLDLEGNRLSFGQPFE